MNYLVLLQELRDILGGAFSLALLYMTDIVAGIIGIIVPAAIYWCLDKRAGNYMLTSFSASCLMTQTLKCVFCVYRPFVKSGFIQPYERALDGATGYSLPSGHVTMATSLYGSLAVWQKKRKRLVIFCIAMTLLTAFARNFFGVHTLWDVLAGMAVAAVMLLAVHYVFALAESKRNADIIILAASLLITAACILLVELKSYPLDYMADGYLLVDPFEMKTDCYRAGGIFSGYIIGWFIERRFVKFETEVSRKCKCIRLAAGVVIMLSLYLFLLPMLLDPLGEHWGKLLKYFVVFICITAGYPALFKAVEKAFKKA